MPEKQPIYLRRIGVGFILLGLILLAYLGLFLAGVVGPSGGGGHTVPAGNPGPAIFALLLAIGSFSGIFVGFLVRGAGKRIAEAPKSDINVPAFVSLGLGVFSIPVLCFQWAFLVSDSGFVRTHPHWNPAGEEDLVTILVGRVEWDSLLWVCPLPIAAIVVGALATLKARRLGGVAIRKSVFGLAVGASALLSLLYEVVVETPRVLGEVRTSQEETDTYVLSVDKVNLRNFGVRVAVGGDGRAGCERIKAAQQGRRNDRGRCLCLKRGEDGPGSDRLSCVPCDLDMFSVCDAWLDDEILDKFHETEMSTGDITQTTASAIPSGWILPLSDEALPPTSVSTSATSMEQSAKRDRVEELTTGWVETGGAGPYAATFRSLPENESTGIQFELTVRSGSEERCCRPAGKSAPNADRNQRCEFDCFSTTHCCAYNIGSLLLDGRPLQQSQLQ
jgi:hypothetical protein